MYFSGSFALNVLALKIQSSEKIREYNSIGFSDLTRSPACMEKSEDYNAIAEYKSAG